MLVDGVGLFANAHGEEVRVDRFVLVDAWYELEAGEVAHIGPADAAAADASNRSAVHLFHLDWVEKVHVWLDVALFAFSVILEVPLV